MADPKQIAIVNAIFGKQESGAESSLAKISPGSFAPAVSMLNRSFNRFDELFEEALNNSFWGEDQRYRFSRLKDGFAVYRSIQNYELTCCSRGGIRKPGIRPGSEIGTELFRFLKSVMTRFRFFENWNQVYVEQALCSRRVEAADDFLKKYSGSHPLNIRFWEKYKKKMVCLNVNFPARYEEDTRVFLRDVLKEEEGTRFAFIYMRKIIVSQVKKLSGRLSGAAGLSGG